ncbi:MAG: hypothetical protein WC661_12290 [Opitutaceae bacterium]|jgi:hypothetical protein
MKPIIIILAVLFTAGCVGPFKKSVWTRPELQEWYTRWVQRPDGKDAGIGYQGSDEKLHYFMARSMDSWIFIRVSRDQIEVPEVHLYHESFFGAPTVYYWLDPSKDFTEKKAPNQALQTTTRTVTPAASHPSRQRVSCLI